MRAPLLVSALLLVASSPGAAQIRVGANVQVSRARSGDAHYEVLVAADPANARRLLVGAMRQPAGAASVSGSIAYVSSDGGETWTPTLETPPPDRRQDASGDPAVAFGPDGVAYFVASLIPPNSAGPTRGMLLYRSRDGGENWEAPVVFTYSDREYIVVDASGGPYHGRIYVNGNSRVGATAGGLTAFWSGDGGRSFTEARMPAQSNAPVMGNAVVLKDGTLIALHSAARTVGPGTAKAPAEGVQMTRLRVSASRDGGRTFDPPFDIADVALVSGRKGAHNNTSNLPAMAVDQGRGVYGNRLYVVWPEYRGDHTSIWLSYSADAGRTWAPARRVSDADAAGRDHFMPNVAVNRDGIVGVVWYDRRERADNLGWDVRFTASRDGGATFLPGVRVSERGARFGAADAWVLESRSEAARGRAPTLDVSLNTFTFLGGDTSGLVADAAGVFHAVWVDNSTGLPQVWTAALALSSDTTAGMGATASGSLHEVTDSVVLETFDPVLDRTTNVLTVQARLLNQSGRPIGGPLQLRVSALRSELGNATIADRDGAAADTGWLFQPVTGDALPPGERTRARTLTFQLSQLKPFREGDRYRRGLLNLSYAVFGR
jgi:hypothetical protein